MEDLTPTQAPSASPSDQLVRQLSENVARSSGWMKFLGVLSIIQGVLFIFTLWGILICWLPIWLGIILFKAGDDAETASRGAPKRLLDYVAKLNRYFQIQGILALILIILVLIGFFLAGMAFFMHFGRGF